MELRLDTSRDAAEDGVGTGTVVVAALDGVMVLAASCDGILVVVFEDEELPAVATAVGVTIGCTATVGSASDIPSRLSWLAFTLPSVVCVKEDWNVL